MDWGERTISAIHRVIVKEKIEEAVKNEFGLLVGSLMYKDEGYTSTGAVTTSLYTYKCVRTYIYIYVCGTYSLRKI